MNKETARTIADSLTWARIISVLPITLVALYDLKWWVFGLYIAAALTDLFDGMFARRAAPSRTDVDLDGTADLILGVATFLWIWLLVPGFVQKYWLPYLPVLVTIEICNTVGRIRQRRFGIPHLPFGRFAMALFFFLLPVLIVWGDVSWLVHAVLVVVIASELQLSRVLWQRRSLA
jgi:phosphatidylglycerophosphate synthase